MKITIRFRNGIPEYGYGSMRWYVNINTLYLAIFNNYARSLKDK